jgi:hypothetical protein
MPGAPAAGAPAAGDLHLFETVLLEASGRYRFLDEHLARMAASAEAPVSMKKRTFFHWFRRRC